MIECTPGDIIRVKVGSVYHYGIYVSDDEVVQFGHASNLRHLDGDDIKVLSTDIDMFANGQFVEVGNFTFHDHKKSFKPETIIGLAKSRLGEGGYDMLTNNCEHFAFECYCGEHYSSQEESIKKKWSGFKVK